MTDILNKICTDKYAYIAAQKKRVPYAALEAMTQDAPPPRGFHRSIRDAEGPAIIAEVKKGSPSKGILRHDFDPAAIARLYEDHGAACVSVLTDEPYFHGHDDHFRAVRQTIDLPLIRKDFMLDPYQIMESRALGADCILLIMAALSDSQAQELFSLAQTLGMDCLIEVHDKKEIERAALLSPEMIGVNNRNLNNLVVDINVSFNLFSLIPSSVTAISESGISSAEEIKCLFSTGYKGFLIGETLMKQQHIESGLQSLLNNQFDTKSELK